MIDFKAFESLGSSQPTDTNPVYIREPQGKLRRTASVKVWNKIGVGRSSIDSSGVFCVDYIQKGEVFEVAPVLVVPADEVKKTSLMDYVFKIDEDTYAVAFGNASLYNHRNQPMAEWKLNPEEKTITFTALRDIEPGEEIFITYGKKYWATRDVAMKTSPNINKTIDK